MPVVTLTRVVDGGGLGGCGLEHATNSRGPALGQPEMGEPTATQEDAGCVMVGTAYG